MNKFFAASFLIAILMFGMACQTLFPPAFQDKATYSDVEIAGSPEFIEQTRSALALLEERDTGAFEKVQAYVGIIKQGKHSGMWVWENPPRYEVANATAFSSVTWYASTIAHDAAHSELYAQYKLANPDMRVPEEAYGGVKMEIYCNLYQLQVLKNIGAPQNEIDYVAKLDGTHCDVDHDGDCDMSDYQMRNW